MDSLAHCCIDHQNVVHETIDGEAILVHLDTGSYYSLDGSGAHVWALIEGGCSAERIVDRLEEAYEAPREDIASAVQLLVTQLIEERLLVPAEGNGRPAPGAMPSQNGAAERAPFSAPVLRKYTDMQELLVVDPIHEVDAAGWPHRAPA